MPVFDPFCTQIWKIRTICMILLAAKCSKCLIMFCNVWLALYSSNCGGKMQFIVCHGVAKTKAIGPVTIASPSLHVDKQMERVFRFVSGHLWHCQLVAQKTACPIFQIHPFTHPLSGRISPADPSVNHPRHPGECLCKHNRCSSWVSHYSTWQTPTGPLSYAHTENKRSYDSFKQKKQGSCSKLVQ